MNDSPPALLRGKEWRCPPEIEQLPTSPGCLCQGRFIASLDDIEASWNTGGAALLREARRAGLRFSTGRSSSGGHRRAPTATSRLGLALRQSGASRRGKMCWIASVCFCTAENCWAQSSTVSPNSQARPRLHQLLVHFRKERNQGRAWSRATACAEEPIISPRGLGTRRCARLQPQSCGGPGKHGRQLWVRFGGGRDTRGVQLRRIVILRGRLPIPRCRDRHLILYRRAE